MNWLDYSEGRVQLLQVTRKMWVPCFDYWTPPLPSLRAESEKASPLIKLSLSLSLSSLYCTTKVKLHAHFFSSFAKHEIKILFISYHARFTISNHHSQFLLFTHFINFFTKTFFEFHFPPPMATTGGVGSVRNGSHNYRNSIKSDRPLSANSNFKNNVKSKPLSSSTSQRRNSTGATSASKDDAAG